MLYPDFKINKPIKFISLFSGYDSGALSLKYLGVDFEHYKTCEWAVKSIQALKDLHFENDNTDYSQELSVTEVKKYLYNKGISSNYNEPMTKKQIDKLNENQARNIYNNIKATKNLVNIQQVKGKDLNIVNTDIYTYILTYSFPCQDLSNSGLKRGMSDTSTRSGMLWEVERILTELEEKPQVLLMENVPQVHSADNTNDFNRWQLRLEELGYKNYWQDLIATDYGIPQTRNRCFMVSILGDYNYTFPQPIPLKLKLKDMLEDEVDEKYYLSEKMINYIKSRTPSGDNKITTGINIGNRNSLQKASTLTTSSGNRSTDNFILENEDYDYIKEDGDFINIKNRCKQIYDLNYYNHEQSNRVYDIEYSSPTLRTKSDDAGTIKIEDNRRIGNKRLKETIKKYNIEDICYIDAYNQRIDKDKCGTITTGVSFRNETFLADKELRIRKLTPKECFRLMGVKDKDFEKIKRNQSDSSLYHLAGDSIVVNVLMAIFKEML